MSLSRYAVLDAYTLEELRREYQNTDAKGRICLLEKLYQGNSIAPFGIALLAATDPHVEVRQWIARRGKSLDYRDVGSLNERNELLEVVRAIGGQPAGPVDDPQASLNLVSRLKNDPDSFVRACLRENPNVFSQWFSGPWMGFCKEATHLERLALVRNPSVETSLIEKVFDPEDKELDITLEERRELVFAFLSNKELLTTQEARADLPGADPSIVKREFDPSSGLGMAMADKFLRQLWQLASKWPRDSGVPYLVYRHVPMDDTGKAEIYQKCNEPLLRRQILETCKGEYPKTIDLGMKDNDDACRYLAYYEARRIEPEVLESILQRESAINLSALGGNRSLPVDQLKKVKMRLEELGDVFGPGDAEETIRGIQLREWEAWDSTPPKDPEELFGRSDRKGNFLQDKIDVIGNKILSIEKMTQDIVERLKYGEPLYGKPEKIRPT